MHCHQCIVYTSTLQCVLYTPCWMRHNCLVRLLVLGGTQNKSIVSLFGSTSLHYYKLATCSLKENIYIYLIQPDTQSPRMYCIHDKTWTHLYSWAVHTSVCYVKLHTIIYNFIIDCAHVFHFNFYSVHKTSLENNEPDLQIILLEASVVLFCSCDDCRPHLMACVVYGRM